MTACDVCGQNSLMIYECQRCEELYCPGCGDLEVLLCKRCLSDEW
ncbi:MAG: hypothetical protein V3T58_06575 [Candidatus Hydrothermarchaeales archaeon]